MHIPLSRQRNTYVVTLTRYGAPVWTSPALFGYTEWDARFQAGQLYRDGLGLERDVFGALPGIDGYHVEKVREAHA